MRKHYLTGIEALNYHGADWHSFACDFNREYPKEVREWAGDYGVVEEKNREVADTVRAFLDYLFYEIRFEERVPTRRVSDLNFSDEEEREIEEQVEKLLKPALRTEQEREILRRWISYNQGGEYEPIRFKLLDREPWRKRAKKVQDNARRFREALRKAVDL